MLIVVTLFLLVKNWVKLCAVVKFSIISNALSINANYAKNIYLRYHASFIHFFYTKFGNFVHITHLTTNCYKVTNSQNSFLAHPVCIVQLQQCGLMHQC